jgi:DNA-binding response OmpR family regulator
MLNAASARTRVLVVEDDLDAQRIYEGTLSHAGYEVTIAGTVGEAKRAVRTYTPRLVVLDSRLPDGNGTELLRSWKRCPEMSNVPVLMVTAFSGEHDVQAAALAGADAFLVKPCYGPALTKRLSQFVTPVAPRRRRSSSSEPRVSLTLAEQYRAKGSFHRSSGSELQARCDSCLRASPALGADAVAAEKRAVRLGWSLRRERWSCPVCIERLNPPRTRKGRP